MIIDKKDLNYLVKPILIACVIVVLITITISIGISQISAMVSMQSELKINQLKLTEKLDTLESVSQTLSENITYVDLALPYKASILFGLAQIKNLAADKSINITNLKAGGQVLEDNGLSKNLLTFEAEGLESDMNQFLLSFYSALPLMTVDKDKLNNAAGLTSANVTVYVYSAELPQKIPAITDSVTGLSGDDIQTLKMISEYTTPTFVEPTANEGLGRTDPFTEEAAVSSEDSQVE